MSGQKRKKIEIEEAQTIEDTMNIVREDYNNCMNNQQQKGAKAIADAMQKTITRAAQHILQNISVNAQDLQELKKDISDIRQHSIRGFARTNAQLGVNNIAKACNDFDKLINIKIREIRKIEESSSHQSGMQASSVLGARLNGVAAEYPVPLESPTSPASRTPGGSPLSSTPGASSPSTPGVSSPSTPRRKPKP